MSKGMTYEATGVKYAAMDPFKRMAQLAGRETAGNIRRLNNGEFQEFQASRGESVYLIEAAKSYFAHVEEGLGTKNLVADAMYQLTGKSYYYYQVAQDTVAMIVNDMITLGALPLSVVMHLAVGDSGWFDDQRRCQDLVEGWKQACDFAGCVWGGGETPTLRDVILPQASVLSGSAFGLIKPKEWLIKGDIKAGDAIILVESSGIHANGLTMARKIAQKLPDGYLTLLSDGRTYGETLLDPTIIYVPLIELLLDHGVRLRYIVNITGHGWRKLMRHPGLFTYVINHIPKPHLIFGFMQEHGPVDDLEAYGNLNMGAGLALYVDPNDILKTWQLVEKAGLNNRFKLLQAGSVEASTEKKVVIKPKGIEFKAETLQVR